MRGLTNQERIQLCWAVSSVPPEERNMSSDEEIIGDRLYKRGLVIPCDYISPVLGKVWRYRITSVGRLMLQIDSILKNEFKL